MAAGATVEIESPAIAGSVYAAGERVRISGTIRGDVRAAGEEIVIASGTTIGGDLRTFGPQAPTVEDGVVIEGERHHEMTERDQMMWETHLSVADWVRSVVTWFLAGVVLLYVLRGAATETVERAFAQSGRSLGLGFLAALLALPAALAAALTIIGLPLAGLIILLAAAHLIVAHALAALILGAWVVTAFFKSAATPAGLKWQHVLLGAILLKAIGLIPVVGSVAILVLMLLAWGALLQVFWRRLRSQSQAASPGE
jgi:hypothetical protein